MNRRNDDGQPRTFATGASRIEALVVASRADNDLDAGSGT